ncbi:hypothetical protein LTS12_029267, partial [Elasticomyces elasticus]
SLSLRHVDIAGIIMPSLSTKHRDKRSIDNGFAFSKRTSCPRHHERSTSRMRYEKSCWILFQD